MNWVLVIVLYWSSGTSSQQIGPYVSSADCEGAFTVIESQDVQSVKEHFCVPVGQLSSTQYNVRSFPKEFD